MVPRSHLTAVNALYEYENITKPNRFLDFFTAIKVSFSPFRPFYRPKWQIPYTLSLKQVLLSGGDTLTGGVFPQGRNNRLRL